MSIFRTKCYLRIKMRLKKVLKKYINQLKDYEFLCRIFASFGILVALAFLISAIFSQMELSNDLSREISRNISHEFSYELSQNFSKNNQQLKYYSWKPTGTCCKKCAVGKFAYSSQTCRAAMKWPVKPPHIVKAFNPPPKPWMAGHRGVDLAAKPGTSLFAPADGVISFVGKVAGKSVVTIRHGELTSTFEPAVTNLSVGVSVKQGQKFGHVEGGSDHCGKRCVQWGLKRKNRTYVNPSSMTVRKRIVLKPAA